MSSSTEEMGQQEMEKKKNIDLKVAEEVLRSPCSGNSEKQHLSGSEKPASMSKETPSLKLKRTDSSWVGVNGMMKIKPPQQVLPSHTSSPRTTAPVKPKSKETDSSRIKVTKLTMLAAAHQLPPPSPAVAAPITPAYQASCRKQKRKRPPLPQLPEVAGSQNDILDQAAAADTEQLTVPQSQQTASFSAKRAKITS